MTPLSYSLPAFRPGDYAAAEARLQDLKSLGFRWVTFTPTYLVHDEVPLRIDVVRGPGAVELRAAVDAAHGLGLQVQLNPHLDFETTLTGGPYDWRRRMYFSPKEAYLDEVLLPLADMLPDALTLGSELDVSLVAFAEDWAEVRKQVPVRIAGHKLNGDSLQRRSESIREALNTEKARRGEEPVGWWAYRRRVSEIGRYLSTLEFTSFSFYPAYAGSMDSFTKSAAEKKEQLIDVAGEHPCFAIGEFGLGSSDLTRPWYFDASTFSTAEALASRRQYYLDFLQALTAEPELFGPHPASFWTVGHFDFLEGPFRDDELRSAVSRYNVTLST